LAAQIWAAFKINRLEQLGPDLGSPIRRPCRGARFGSRSFGVGRKGLPAAGNARNRQPGSYLHESWSLRRRHFDVLRHDGVKIEAYPVSRAEENLHRL